MNNFLGNFLSGDRKWLKMIILALIIVIIIFIAMTIIFVIGDNSGEKVPPGNTFDVVNSHFGIVSNINSIKYDPQLTFESAGKVDLSGAKGLKPIENNILKKAKGKGSKDILFDSEIVKRVILFDSSWAKNQTAFAQKLIGGSGDEKAGATLDEKSVSKNSEAADKLKKRGGKAQVAFHDLDFGAIAKGSGKNYFVLVREKYTLADQGKLYPKESIVCYKLVPSGDEMIVEDYQELKS